MALLTLMTASTAKFDSVEDAVAWPRPRLDADRSHPPLPTGADPNNSDRWSRSRPPRPAEWQLDTDQQ